MIDAQGTIVSVDGEHAVVRMDETGCGRCHEPGGCGGYNIGRMLCTPPRDFKVMNPKLLSVGSRVTVAIAEGSVRRSAIIAYAFPLLILFLGASGGLFFAGEIGAIAGSLGGLFLSAFAIRPLVARSASIRHASPFIRD
jgi:sigma-E factor negative regulatory protein RseC